MSYFQATAAERLLGLLERIWGLKVPWEGGEKQPFVKRAPSCQQPHPPPLQKVLGRPARAASLHSHQRAGRVPWGWGRAAPQLSASFFCYKGPCLLSTSPRSSAVEGPGRGSPSLLLLEAASSILLLLKGDQAHGKEKLHAKCEKV